MNNKIAELLNDQINKEFYSAYLYMDMANYFYSTPRMVYLGVSYQF